MFIICLLLWILFNARLDLEVLATGVVVAGLVYGFCYRFLGHSPRKDLAAMRKIGAFIRYAAILVWETVLSNIEVSRLVFAKKIEVSPCIIFFQTDLKSRAARVALSNSITLTPGTITVALTDDLLCVHCLDKKMAQGIEESSFVRQLRRIEEKESSEEAVIYDN